MTHPSNPRCKHHKAPTPTQSSKQENQNTITRSTHLFSESQPGAVLVMVPLALCAVVALSCQVKGGDFRCWANLSKLCPSCQSDISNWPRSEKSPMRGGSTYLRIGELLLLIIKLENLPWPRCRVPMLGKELKDVRIVMTVMVMTKWWWWQWWVWKWKPEEWWWSSLRFLSNSSLGREHGLCLVS